MQRYPGWERRLEARRAQQPSDSEAKTNIDWRASIQAWLATATVIIAIATPALYAAGQSLDQTYLHAFGVSESMFPKTSQEYITAGISAFANSIANLLPSLWEVVSETYPYVAFVVFMTKLCLYMDNEDNPPPRMLLKLGPQLQVRKWIAFLGDTLVSRPFQIYSSILFALMAALLIVAVPFLAGSDVGKTSAEKTIYKRRNLCTSLTGPLTADCVEVTKGERVVARGAVVAASDKWLAIYSNGTTTIFENKEVTLRVMISNPLPL